LNVFSRGGGGITQVPFFFTNGKFRISNFDIRSITIYNTKFLRRFFLVELLDLSLYLEKSKGLQFLFRLQFVAFVESSNGLVAPVGSLSSKLNSVDRILSPFVSVSGFTSSNLACFRQVTL